MIHQLKPWANRSVIELNRQDAHSAWGAYESEAQARACDRGASRFALDLTGEWQFRLYPSPEDVPEDIAAVSDLVPIQVPGNFELQGHSKPIYTNVMYPWPLRGRQALTPREGGPAIPNPPEIPEDNPTGLYVHGFTVEAPLLSREARVTFDGVESCFCLWVNGRFAGFSQDSKLPAEFDISAFLRPGENTLALMAPRWCSSSYLEDQDYWHISGIFRPARIIFKPKLHIKDWKVEAGCDGAFRADVEVSRVDGFADSVVSVALYDPDGSPLFTGEAAPNGLLDYRQDRVPRLCVARVDGAIECSPWTPETPALYTMVFTLRKGGEILDVESTRVGFRTVEIQRGVILLNGRRLIVRGVNRHEHCAPHGRAVPLSHMREELLTMKWLNINAVRTSHYPDDPRFYDLCDEIGMLVVCECNLETHGVAGAISHDPAWAAHYVTRAMRMVMFHKNHPCVFSWSLGNESGTGANHAAMAGWIREYDPTRLCQYEAGFPGPNISDVRGWMYAPQRQILEMLTDPNDTRPVVLVEFSYQIRNSGGGLHKFPQFVERYQRFQGGFIWDWQDKALVNRAAAGEPYYAYGGDFGEEMVDTECPVFMCCNGIVLPDLTPKPSGLEAKQAYCPITIQRGEASAWHTPDLGAYYVKNNCLALSTAAFMFEGALLRDGEEVKMFPVEVPELRPGEQREIAVRPEYDARDGHEYHLNIDIRYAADTEWAKAGDSLGLYQFELPGARAATIAPKGVVVAYTRQDGQTIVTGDHFEARFDEAAGLLASYKVGGQEYLRGGSAVCNRPYSGLDYHPGLGARDLWDQLHEMAREVTSFEAYEANGRAHVTITSALARGDGHQVRCEARYVVYGDGTIEIDMRHDADPALMRLPRLGLEFEVAEGFNDLTFFGRGPGESYCDRTLSTPLGLYNSTVDAQHFPFIPPAECGGHEAVRFLRASTATGRALTVTGSRPFHFDMRRASIGEYVRARHDHELPRRAAAILHLDAAHAGIGGDMAWSTVHAEEAMIRPGEHQLKVYIKGTQTHE